MGCVCCVYGGIGGCTVVRKSTIGGEGCRAGGLVGLEDVVELGVLVWYRWGKVKCRLEVVDR